MVKVFFIFFRFCNSSRLEISFRFKFVLLI
nr:MAG TPA: hypothetical protein [Caudoviricetes sp.]